MANQKANIYPIQLQGAELNLNKYDAEIKQYSGFNKNNSPYVGGCLANVFTKDTTIEDGTPDNVYIDTNGDVYELKTDGFYKNDVKILDIPEVDNNFVHIEKLPQENDVIRYITPKIKVKKILNTWYVNDVSIGENINNLSDDFIAYHRIVANCSNWTNGSIKVFANINSQCFILNFNKNGELTGNEHFEINYYSIQENERYLAFDSENGVFVNYIDNDVLIIRKYNPYPAQTYYFNKESQITYYDIYGRVRNVVWDNLLDTFYVGTMHYNLRVDGFYAKKLRTSSSISGNENIKCSLSLISISNVVIDENSHFVLSASFSGSSNILNLSKTQYLEDGHFNYFYEKDYYNLLITPFFVSGYLNINCSSNFTALVLLSSNVPQLEKNVRHPVYQNTYNMSKNVCGFKFQLQGFSLLFNNNTISGLGTDNDTLLTDWNSVQADSLVIFGNEIVYKDSKEFYHIYFNDSPKLKKVGSQLVFNIKNLNNKRNNCYFLDTRTFGEFGCDYNMFVYEANNLTSPSSYNHIYKQYNAINNYTFAISKDEYNRKNNPSLLLNPISVHVDLTYFQLKNVLPNNSRLNLYDNQINDNEIIYEKTLNPDSYYFYNNHHYEYNNFVNKELVGLPYPQNSDGNIEYSPSLFSEVKSVFGNQIFIKSGGTFYPLMIGNNNLPVMSFYMTSGLDNLQDAFIIQGQHYGIINNGIYTINYESGVVSNINFVVDITGLQYCGNTPYMAIFFSKTNRCLYSFVGANVLNKLQFVDKINEIINYSYNPATQSTFLITDIGVIVMSSFGTFLLELPNIVGNFILDNGAVFFDADGHYTYIKYYLDDGDTDFTKQNIQLETCFYGSNNEMVNIADCLYFRIFSPEHEEGDLKVSATTLRLEGRKTEETTFKIKSSDWDPMTDSIYLRYQPKDQKGIGVSFAIDSPFKIASLSVGSTPDSIQIDKVSKAAITSPQQTSNNTEW